MSLATRGDPFGDAVADEEHLENGLLFIVLTDANHRIDNFEIVAPLHNPP